MPIQNVLIADSDQPAVAWLKEALQSRQMGVRTALDGSRALELALAQVPDAIFIGAQLPMIGSAQLIDILSANPRTRGVPIIQLVDAGDGKAPKPAKEGQLQLLKPLQAKDVWEMIANLSGRREKMEEVSSKPKEIEGNLSQISLADLLQILSMNKKDGTITVVPAEGEPGFIYLQGGSVINASLGRIEGDKAFYRMLLWTDGKFEYTPESALSPVRIKTSMENLLMEGARHIDEFKRIKAKLPGAESHLALNVEPNRLPKGLRPITQEIFLLLEFYSKVQDIVDNCLYPDFEVYQTLYTLLSKGLVREVEEERRLGQEALLAFEEVLQLSEVLASYDQDKLSHTTGQLLVLAHHGETVRKFIQRCRALEQFHLIHDRGSRQQFSQAGMTGVLPLSEKLDLVFLHAPVHRLATPLWHILSTQVLGVLLVFDGLSNAEQVALQRAQQFFTKARRPCLLVDLLSPENEHQLGFHRQVFDEEFGANEDETFFPLPSTDREGVRRILKTLLMHIINQPHGQSAGN